MTRCLTERCGPECQRKVRCGLARGANLLSRRRTAAARWSKDLDTESAFGGPPGWVFSVGWGYFTPEEQDVLARWRSMHDCALKAQVLARDKQASIR